ncbi:tyrosine-type recombinase/integrase [Kyrpidia tusciae]|uniref:tyrosine-type recombinase/integrase n=1 Tax=Kyrpidia tusciae TaxID=33943 RepID=UPI000694E905|nr:phage integrase N-terminal SAM-like domain-containing protein [Kyrpidia tusciae]
MRPTDFALLLTRYLSQHLPAQRNLSRQTIQSYRDTFKLLLRFCQAERGWVPENITLAQIDRACIEAFLDWIETVRHCTVATRNQRLAALKSFFRWVSYEAPEHLESTQRVLGIPWKKTGQPKMMYLTANAVQALLAQPDRTTPAGRRDATLLALLYDTGARVQELVDLRVRDVRIESPAVVTLTGKAQW